MFMINNKIDLLVVLPLTREFSILKREAGFAIRWLNFAETQWEIKIKSPSLISFLEEHVINVSKYQREPFRAGSASHQWIWHYEESIPAKIKDPSATNDHVFQSRCSMKLLPEDFGKGIMSTYIKEQLKKREKEYVLLGELKVFIGTWNCAGTAPDQFLIKWLRGNNEISDTGCDVIAICLQEICALSAMNLLGDEAREDEWKNFLVEQIAIAYPDENYSIVGPI